MELTVEESYRIDLIRFPLIVGVVFGHAFDSILQFGGVEAALAPTGFAASFIIDFIGQGLAFTAVPCFFFLSGFLFFYRMEWSGPVYFTKLKSRVFTLLVPFLFWNILYLILYAVVQEVPFTAQYLSGGVPRITHLNVSEIFNLIFGVTRNPIAFQFWFIRDLMLLVLLTPIFHLMHKKIISLFFLAAFFGVWFFSHWLFLPHPEAIFFFFAGSLLAVNNKTLFSFDRLGLAMVGICLVFFAMNTLFQEKSFSSMLYKAGLITGVLAGLYASKVLLHKKVAPIFMWLGTTSFFVFAFHEPFMGFVQRVIIKVYLPTNDLIKLLFFFAIPLLVIFVAIGLFTLLNRILPKFTAIITGGRATRRISEKIL